MSANDTIRILVVDDHPVVREGLVAILATEPSFRVVGEAASGEEAIASARAARERNEAPDVVLLDLEMPGMDGIAAIEALAGVVPDAGVVVFTAFDADERIFQAVHAGAKGYLLKGAPRLRLFEAIRTVHVGGTLLEPIVASKLMRKMQEPESKSPLTARETQVLELLSKGLQNREIAGHLGISDRTVKFHVSAIFRKLDVSNRTEAVTISVQMGILEL